MSLRSPALYLGRSCARVALSGAVIWSLAMPQAATAQIVPNAHWRTLETEHFRVHFTPELEELARRSAGSAEWAHALLSRELVAPRGKVDLVIADNVDFTNGYATPFPSNRIVVYAHPPVDENSLRNYQDWATLVITHELTHIFHLDRAGGVWGLGRALFGRHPALFPAAYQPGWVVEGLAVYYESRITGAGRLEGSQHEMIARAAAESQAFPRLGEISLSTSRYPAGETVYAYGGFIFDHLARTRGAESVTRFVELASSSVFPITLNGKARRAFGVSFEQAWSEWRDSLLRAAPVAAPPLRGWRELTAEGWLVTFPRWLGDTAIVYSATTGREVSGSYRVTVDGRVQRLARRNSLGANAPLPNGDVLFTQPDFLDPHTLRSDLYIQRGAAQIRLTRGARLSAPDIRVDGEIVAVQLTPGSTRLVRVAADGSRITPLVDSGLDTQWTDPRWSPDGTRIAAVRLDRGETSAIVVLDTLGAVRAIREFRRAQPAAPSWSADGARIVYAADPTGPMQIYSFPVSSPDSVTQLSATTTGLFAPAISPDSRLIAAVHFRADGYHLGVAPAPGTVTTAADTVVRRRRDICPGCLMAGGGIPPEALRSDAPARPYRAFRSLLPRFWEPIAESTGESGSSWGVATSGWDIVGRHAYSVQVARNTKFSETEGFAVYQYAGLGQPYVSATVQQSYDHQAVFDAGETVVGDLSEDSRVAGLSASFVRPRVRTSGAVSFGAELEVLHYRTRPDSLLAFLPSRFAERARHPAAFISAGWTNTRRPFLAISREDGVSLSASARQRWAGGNGDRASRSLAGVGSGYKSLDLPGFSHHVLAVRLAGAIADNNATSTFALGGLSGGSIDVLSGLTVGDERRTFGLRGFPPSAERGIRAVTATAEYRAPIAIPSRRVRFIPLLFDRISTTAFVETGRAWCPTDAVGVTRVCTQSRVGVPWLASAGGEINLDAALHYDFPARLRFGVALPIANRDFARARAVSTYLTFGSAF